MGISLFSRELNNKLKIAEYIDGWYAWNGF